jgi:hypothetical protein
MSGFLIAPENHLVKASNPILANDSGGSPNAATNFPVDNLIDGLSSVPFRFNAAADGHRLEADLNRVINGSFESWTGALLDAWTLETSATAVQETSNPIDGEGTSSVKITGAIYQDVLMPVGSLCVLRNKSARYSGGSSDAVTRLIDLDNGDYLLPGNTWSATNTALFSVSNDYATAGWDQEISNGIVFTTQAFSNNDAGYIRIRIRLSCGTGGGGDVGILDAVSLHVVPNITSFHGHNIRSNHTIDFRGLYPDSSHSSSYASSGSGSQVGRGELQSVPSVNPKPSYYFRMLDNTPVLDGVSDYYLDSSPVAMADTGKLTFSVWLRRNEDTGATQRLIQLGGTFAVDIGSNHTIRAIVHNPSAVVVWDSTTSATPGSNGRIFPDANWHHLLISWDSAATARGQIWIDGADANGSNTTLTTSGLADWSGVSSVYVGSSGVSIKYSGALNYLYFHNTYSADLAVAANVEKFRYSYGVADLGATGSTPSGDQPYMWHVGTHLIEGGGLASFQDNKGSSGDLVENGAPTTEAAFCTELAHQVYFQVGGDSYLNDAMDKTEIAEWFIGRAITLTRQRIAPHPAQRIRPMIELKTPSGDIFRSSMSHADVKRFSFSFLHAIADREQWKQIRDMVKGGEVPVVIVPDADKLDVHFGYLSVSFDESMDYQDMFHVSIDFRELPFVASLT